MRYRRLGGSELEVPVVSFGAWAIGGWLWGGTDDEAAVRALHAAIDHGMTLIDTAPMYGMGHSEEIVGKAVAGHRDRVLIATKCGLRWDCADGEMHFKTVDNNGVDRDVFRNLRPASIRYECEQSLRRLRVDHIDLYQCHWPDPTTPLADAMGTLLQLKKEGKIRAIGLSNFSREQIAECLAVGRVDSDQPRYSALDRRAEEEILPYCRENAVGILAYSPLEQGLLTGTVDPDRQFNEGDQRRTKPLFSRENRIKVLRMLDAARPIAEKYEASFGQLFLAWLIAQEGMTTALAGTRDEAQLLENAAAGDLELIDADVAAIRDLVESVRLDR